MLIVDDDALVRAGLAMMLGGAADLDIVGEAEDGTQVIAAIDAHRPDVVLMDIRMPRLDGLAALAARPRAARSAGGHRPDDVRRRRPRPHRPARRRRGLSRQGHAADGDHARDPPRRRGRRDAVADRHAQARWTTWPPTARLRCRRTRLERLGELTDREREVAVAVGQGSSNAEVAAELYMSIATVKAHVSRLLMKLDLDNRVQIALLVHDAGLSAGAR